eukprot:CAMPEP_0178992498 /NCGR_PEP_ID=MMETSP0795-20121207/6149_1 /TAXON_ID=88552 /ORGANISM="Amoebophrya sp., Strain Ameob2" /LENGTH=553 /DNA_ID=CAMNT_0020684389 /DNA_START=31 /DNA_END=1692 /DNA_ORIENTATION=-
MGITDLASSAAGAAGVDLPGSHEELLNSVGDALAKGMKSALGGAKALKDNAYTLMPWYQYYFSNIAINGVPLYQKPKKNLNLYGKDLEPCASVAHGTSTTGKDVFCTGDAPHGDAGPTEGAPNFKPQARLICVHGGPAAKSWTDLFDPTLEPEAAAAEEAAGTAQAAAGETAEETAGETAGGTEAGATAAGATVAGATAAGGTVAGGTAAGATAAGATAAGAPADAAAGNATPPPAEASPVNAAATGFWLWLTHAFPTVFPAQARPPNHWVAEKQNICVGVEWFTKAVRCGMITPQVDLQATNFDVHNYHDYKTRWFESCNALGSKFQACPDPEPNATALEFEEDREAAKAGAAVSTSTTMESQTSQSGTSAAATSTSSSTGSPAATDPTAPNRSHSASEKDEAAVALERAKDCETFRDFAEDEKMKRLRLWREKRSRLGAAVAAAQTLEADTQAAYMEAWDTSCDPEHYAETGGCKRTRETRVKIEETGLARDAAHLERKKAQLKLCRLWGKNTFTEEMAAKEDDFNFDPFEPAPMSAECTELEKEMGKDVA